MSNINYHEELSETIKRALLHNGLCFSVEEAEITADEILYNVSIDESFPCIQSSDSATTIMEGLMDYFDLTVEDAENIVRAIFPFDQKNGLNLKDDSTSAHSYATEEEEKENKINESEESGDESNYLNDGDCELCERYMKLTSHHLVPKSVWPKLKKRIFESKKNPKIRQETILFISSLKENKVPSNDNDLDYAWSRQSLHSFLSQYTCQVCRPCHSKIHSSHDNTALADHYNTVDKLLTDRNIYKFCKWANKQKPGKYKK